MRAHLLFPLTSLTAALAVSIGCASDGQTGEQGEVRFSLIVNYSDTSDINAPIAAGRPVFIALQRPQVPDLIVVDQPTLVGLTLGVESSEGDAVESVWPVGFAQYGVVLEEAGSYRLVARDGSLIKDTLGVTAEPLDALELSDRVFVSTRVDNEQQACTKFEEISGLAGFTLHRNQEIEVAVLPKSASGQNLLGMLALTAKAPDFVELDSPIVGQGRLANSIIVRAKGELPPEIELSISEVQANRTLTTRIAAVNEDAVISCR